MFTDGRVVWSIWERDQSVCDNGAFLCGGGEARTSFVSDSGGFRSPCGCKKQGRSGRPSSFAGFLLRSLDSFLNYMTVQSLTEEGLKRLGQYVATMAEVERLDAYRRAVTHRLQDIESRQVTNTR
ncbi:hypothetical protein Ddye_028911 [Dipteronia dyeriana]|uniref:histidinol dehydrogenase n=1 Tax=Dipteronia dyeriana TaxID=168575 RepID=A0AAD9TDG2_9ROSI|nr:hypothetical protein Ddye_028911 [Dipteronia dyeriana]